MNKPENISSVSGLSSPRLYLLALFIASAPLLSVSQNNKADSLRRLLSLSLHDTVRVNILNAITWEYKFDNPDTSFLFINRAITLAEKINFKSGSANALRNKGGYYLDKGNYPEALKYYFESLRLSEKMNDKTGIIKTLGNIGIVYHSQFDYSKALNYYFKALELAEQMGDEQRRAVHLGNIGIAYMEQANYSKALEYYFEALKIDERLGNKEGVSRHLGNIGTVYTNQAELLASENDAAGEKENLALALDYYFRALKLSDEMDDRNGIAVNLGNIGSLYIKSANYKEAERYLKRSLSICDSIGATEYKRQFEKYISSLYELTGRHKLALLHYRKYISISDSINNEANTKQQMQLEMQYEFDKKEAVAKAKQEKKDALALEELERQKMQRNGFIGGFALMLGLAGVSYRSYRNKRKANEVISRQKEEVEKQKHLVEEKQKEILDSINYAKRIQEAILPSRDSLIKNLKNGFVLFRPKDVVSGDFYWLEKFEDKVYFAAADCTGHGVPGAMVSVVCSNALSKALLEEKITDPGKILDRTRELVIERFAKSGEDVKDGMDISLASLSLSALTLHWAGANNPLWLIRGQTELIELKPDKQPVGKYAENKPFTTHTIELMKGDTIYVFTDGYVDQFGGESGKKFKAANLKKLLLSIQNETMDRQKKLINETFENWMIGQEQVDDVSVIGVRV